jgi:predicted AAA+ superfamily ATPase
LVVITGARQTGKTTLARGVYRELRYLNLDAIELRESMREVASSAWANSVGPAVLDEAQKEASVFDKVKYAYDEGELDFSVLLGSSRILLLERVRETLAGRAFLYELWPLMASELTHAPDETPAQPIFDRLISAGSSAFDELAELAEVEMGEADDDRRAAWQHLGEWGGMPELLRLEDEDRRTWLGSYQQTFLERDLADLVRLRDLEPFRLLQRLCMLRTGQLLSFADLGRDAGLSPATVRRYVEYLTLSYQVLLLPPFHRNLTSALAKAPKLHFTDLGLLRHVTKQRGPLEGALLETLVIAELHKWISTLGRPAELFSYRTRSGMELDALVQTEHGLIGIEIKSRRQVEAADARALVAVAAASGKDWCGGLIVHQGRRLHPVVPEQRIWAVPVHRLL